MAKKANGFIVLILFFSSLFFWPSLMDKYQVSRYLLQTVILLVAGYFFYHNFKKQPSISLNLIDLSFISFYLIHLLSTFWAFDLGEAVFTTQKVLIGFGIYYFTRLLLVRKNFDLFQTIAWTSFALTAALLLYVPIELINLVSEKGLTNQELYNVSGAMGNKSLLSEFLLLLIPFNIIGSIKTSKKLWFLGLILFQLVMIIILQVRTTYLVLFICGGIYVIWGITKSTRFRKAFFTKALPVGAILSATLFALVRFGGLFPDLSNRLNFTTWTFSNTVAERFFIWLKTIPIISENWLFGVGSGSWKIFFPSNSIEGGWRFESLDTFATRAHNDYLEIFAELGIFGLLSFLAIFGFAFYSGLRKLRHLEKPEQECLLVVLIGLLGYAFISFLDFPKERLEHQTIFAIYIALCAFWGKDYLKVKAPKIPGNWFPVFFGLLMGLLATNIYSGVLRFKGEVHVRKAIKAKTNENWAVLIKESQKAISKLYTIDPTTIPIPWYEGIGYFHQNDLTKAHAAFQKAYRINPYNYHVLNNYGTTMAKQKKYAEAVSLFEEALRINPSFEDCKFNVAFSLYQIGNFERAIYWANQTSNEEKKKVFLDTIKAAYDPGE